MMIRCRDLQSASLFRCSLERSGSFAPFESRAAGGPPEALRVKKEGSPPGRWRAFFFPPAALERPMSDLDYSPDIEILARMAARLAGRDADQHVTIRIGDAVVFDDV